MGSRRARAPRRLIGLSKADTYEEACREWAYTGTFLEVGDEGFEPACQLCHQPGIAISFEILNVHTRHRLLVGQECIRNYLILRGAETLEESRRLFSRKRRQSELVKRILRPCAAAVLGGDPDWDTVYRLHLAAQEYFGFRCGQRFQELDPGEWERFINQVLAGLPEGETLGKSDFRRLRNAILSPRKIAVPPRNRLRNPSRRELVWGRRSPRVGSTLSRGVDAKNPADLSNAACHDITSMEAVL